MKRLSGDATALWIGGIVIVFTAFIFVLWKIGLFDFSGTDASAKIVSASIALVGALFGSLISIAGLILKHSLDQRNTAIKEQAELRLQLEGERNNVLAREAEERLVLDTAIRAVGLLSTSTGSPAPMIQRAGVLFALTSLKRYELAIALTSELLVHNEIDAYSAASILSRISRSGEQDVQETAVSLFEQNVGKFLTSDGNAELPESLFNWDDNLSDYSREWGVIGVARLLASRPLAEWDKFTSLAILCVLGMAWSCELNEELKQAIGAILKTILPVFPNAGLLRHPRQTINMEIIRADVATAITDFEHYNYLIADLEKWVTAAGGKV